ncbi:DUF2975 domain-containing protein [Muriicola sp. SD30]|uniref:DUF2975 domain-containing protein n=1 Tax=Muriicola sp. SD30 TaxID=3240936 RepID=UPI0035108E1A
MKTLFKVLYALCLVWILGAAIKFIEYLSVLARYTHDLVLFSDRDFDINLTLIIALVNAIITIYILFHLFNFAKSIKRIQANVFFSQENGKAFNTIGWAFIYYSILKFIIGVVSGISNSIENEVFTSYNFGHIFGENLGARVPLLTFALFLLIISKLMKDGFELKIENDLTI